MFVFLRKCFVLIVLFLFAAQSIAVGDTAPTPAATPTSTSSNEQPASSEGSGEADAKNSKPPAVKYVRFLDVLPEALDMDDNVRNASLSLRAAVESAKASRSGWFPKADITLNAARQKDIKAGAGAGTDTYNPNEAKLKITQKLWDFGETSIDIEMAGLATKQAKIGYDSAVNAAIMQAAQTYTSLKRAHAQFKIALEGEYKMKKQTGMQDYRIQRGAAVGTDVLQAKNALAGAITGRVAAQGALETAKISFRSKFGFVPENIDALLPVQVPRMLMPKTMEDFRLAVMKDGAQLKQATIAFDRSRLSAEKSFASNFLPKFDLTLEANHKDDAGGARGGKEEYIGKIEMTWPIELFGTQLNTYRAAQLTGEVGAASYAKAKRDLEDKVSVTWINQQNTKARMSYVANQLDIARQFARLAQMEVQRGRGNMNMVVNAQEAIVSAQKDLENANTDFAVQVYSMLADMGALSFQSLTDAAKAEADVRTKAVEDYKVRLKEAQDAMKEAKEEAEKASEASGGSSATAN